MKIVVDEDFLKDVASSIRGFQPDSWILSEVDALIGQAEELKKDIRKLENQEIWIKCFFNGYFNQFQDMSINVEIHEVNPNCKEDGFKGMTTLFPPINEEYNRIDLTPLLFTLLRKMQEKPDGKFKCYATGFSRQMHFNKDLLSTPMPEEILKLFGNIKK